MAWLQQSSLRRNRSVRPCLLLYLHRAHTMLLLKMPVEETKRPAATPLKRVEPFEVLPLPQRTAAKTPNAAAATASGLAPRRLLVKRNEVSEQPITTYRTSTFGIALLVNDSSAFTALWTSGSLLSAPAAATARGGRAVRRTFSPSSVSILVSGLCHPAHVLCVGGPLDARGNFSKFQPCPISLQIEAKHGRTTGEITTCPVAASQQTGVSNVLSDHWHLSLRHNSRVYHSIILCTDAMDRSVVDVSGFFAKECRDRDATELIHVKETSQIY